MNNKKSIILCLIIILFGISVPLTFFLNEDIKNNFFNTTLNYHSQSISDWIQDSEGIVKVKVSYKFQNEHEILEVIQIEDYKAVDEGINILEIKISDVNIPSNRNVAVIDLNIIYETLIGKNNINSQAILSII
ncbi:hypothetical protein PND53_02795 [Faecalitalea cylindroides]|uniref:hypothetical protein n=1 Tax=Faecalitalea cylindroides TaxID=39483 RepID=UPI001899C03C|nr:hypothetical protein [Faecalitalea cylindroides]MDB7946444.1 hypothetical protein [Faecalitalea cylindroides]MDB7948306.1 hypothetical protein [Faecalitalea cylindroides]MDB7950225.1 hypothetical protein [Faecalitalea cylindroides]